MRKKPKPKRGRPPKPLAEVRSQRFVIKLRLDEEAAILAAGGDEPSVWAREILVRAARRRRK